MLRPMALLSIALMALVACEEVVVDAPPPTEQADAKPESRPSGSGMSPSQAARTFVTVKDRMEPIVERACRDRTSGVNCDFRIVVDDRKNAPPNAYQTLDRNGRPIISFTLALIADAKNADEIAFVMGHEAAHHIQGHIERQRRNALAGAVISGALATLTGGDATAVRNAQDIGAQVGARTYSKDFELEADQLGTILTMDSGYDALRGAQFFNRIPDPGDKFLGTHPPNAKRVSTVRRTVESYKAARG
jgi:predicted Zn-dependent protease